MSRSAARGLVLGDPFRLACRLKPGERQTVSYAIAAEWHGGPKHWPRALRADPLFLHPGEYTLRCVFQEDSTDGRPRIAKELTVRVAEPRGDDRTIYEQLQQDPELVDALLMPVESPRDGVLPRLRRLVEKYPRSSYATYARFQLAQRDAVGFPADAERRARGAMALEELLPCRFPYQSFAILRLRDADPREAGRVERLMDRYFPDAVQWLAERQRLPQTTPAAWAEFRRRQPKKWDPTDPDLGPRPERPSGDRP